MTDEIQYRPTRRPRTITGTTSRTFSLTDEEYAEITDKAGKRGLSRTQYLLLLVHKDK